MLSVERDRHMTDRIRILTEKTLKGEMWVEPNHIEYDRTDLLLSPIKMSGKRVCEYIVNQPSIVLEESCFTGLMRFDGSVEGDIFNRMGHRHFDEARKYFYNKPIDNLMTFEWQHSVGDFEKIIKYGINGILCNIEKSKEAHKNDSNALEFLETQTDLCRAILERAKKCSEAASLKAVQAKNPKYRENLEILSKSLLKIPANPAESFYEAVLCIYFCYPFIPDSIGLIDRYLYPYYIGDIKSNKISRKEAGEYLQELFLMLQARISIKSDRFYRGGESHFCIGGYLENGEDGFNELSKLVAESLMDLPTFIPQISLRWTKKTPREVFRYMLDCERKDKNKRIAFVNDEPRIKGLMEYTGLSYKDAVSYTMMGCNELALPGGMVFGFDPINILRCVESTFHKRFSDTEKAGDFEEVYRIFEEELFYDLDEANRIGNGLQQIRSRDCNIVSNIFLEGCIENAKSCTQGGLTRYIAVGLLIGISNVIDSLSVVKQFVFDEKVISMKELLSALKNNWEGYEELHSQIMKKGHFFGNDDDTSNEISRRFFESIRKWNTGDNYLSKKWVFGNLIGYNEHNKFFGSATKATPDGRFDGEMTNFGIGQSTSKDRSGLTALLNSVAKCDPYAILTGPSVTNVLIDKQMIENDDSFEKLVSLFEAYFLNGGTHFQLTYVSKEELIKAKENPSEHRNLRVRVSGFSDYFVNLNAGLQDEIIIRTKHTS